MITQRVSSPYSCQRTWSAAVVASWHGHRASSQSLISLKACRLSTLQHDARSINPRCPKHMTRAWVSQEYCHTYDCGNHDEADDSDDSDDDADPDVRLEVHHVHSRLPLQCVALGDDSTYVISFEDGELAWSGGVSDGLCDVLSKTVKYGKGVAAVALGRNQGSNTYSTAADPDEVWFVMRDTGTTYMGDGCDPELRNEWRQSDGSERVEKVVFAPNCGWHLERKGGGEQYCRLPRSLEEDIRENWDAGDSVQSLSIGHNGEWFVLFESGEYIWSGLHPTLDKLLGGKTALGKACSIEWVEFGPDGTFVALFDTHTVWYGDEELTEDLLASL